MTDRYFVDTNVLVYARDVADAAKQARALEWVRALWKGRAGCLSTQVLNELYVTLTRKLRPAVAATDARLEIRDLLQWKPVALTPAVMEAAWEIEEAHSISYWDALIVAAAHKAGARYILSEDLQEGHDFAGTEVVNPFKTEVPVGLAAPP